MSVSRTHIDLNDLEMNYSATEQLCVESMRSMQIVTTAREHLGGSAFRPIRCMSIDAAHA